MVDHYTPSDDSAGSENNRFDSRVGQVEFRTTIHHIEKYLTPGARILEIGAASGRYSHYFAQRGYEVDAVELVPYNIELFKEKTQEGECVTIRQGNATDLSEFSDETYDVTLLLGPMYHLFERSDKLAAMSEALRVTKPGGVLLTAYCLPDASIVQYGFVRNPDNAQRIIEMGLLDPVSFRAVSRPPEVFDLMYKEDIDALMSGFPSAERISFVATDLLTHYIAPALANMTDEQFELYLRYHLAVCERSDMLGVTNHALDIVRKL
ncbi:MAG: class I SAM-dependent methyltransferase [Oscillospiraceae bacterium]|nr:class I SAM-dependent methyltransferase [Oscillospiraceae bacterium]